jgi:DNA helicase-2/ATP-dependent DNA helicase PcrA
MCKGLVFSRLAKIYDCIMIDEIQDLAGYDLEIIKSLFASNARVLIVGDPRQATYATHFEQKNKKYANGNIKQYITDKCKKLKVAIDETSLGHSYRCNQLICDYAHRLFPHLEKMKSRQLVNTGHDGVYLVSKDQFDRYMKYYSPVQLRWSSATTGVHPEYNVMNFGMSKGQTFPRVIIHLTDSLRKWLKNNVFKLSETTKSKFYVGITRAEHSVAFLMDSGNEIDIPGAIRYTVKNEVDCNNAY